MRALLLVAALCVPSVVHAAEPQVSPILYLNRCTGGCTVHGGVDDARAMSSSIPCPGGADCTGGGCTCLSNPAGDYIIEEFKDSAGNIGTAADAEWNQIMKCVREVYSPYAIQVVDQVPAGGLSHNQGIVAGRPINIGYTSVGGIAPGTSCNPRDNVISFTFANIYGGTGLDRVWEICGVVAQETAHAYGLDHVFKTSDGRSSCTDPLTYQPSCGQKFFRNDNMTCGEYAARPCSCGGFQNSHLKILAIFGPGTPISTPPVVSVSTPASGDTIQNGASVVATASAQRGIARLELWLNNYKWLTVKGAAFGSSGQPETSYPLVFPASVPDGVIDIQVKAFDDINVETDAPTITVTKGAPCSDASTCAKGQKCDAGKCYWDVPTGALGDACTYPQFCESGSCVDTTGGSFCSQDCVVGVADSCPATFTCIGNAGETGVCLVDSGDGGGCCSIGGDKRAAAMLSLLVLGLVLRRRRR